MTMKFEAAIIFPQTISINGTDRCTGEFVARMAGVASHEWGGCTLTEGAGFWNDGEKVIGESVGILTIAMEPTSENDSKLRNMAANSASALLQECVYVRYASGVVELVSPNVSKAEAEAIYADAEAA